MKYLDGISLGGYRSFGADVQRIGPLGKLNLFAGPNNCGKSNILRFIAKHLTSAIHSAQHEETIAGFQDLDKHQLNSDVPLVFGVATNQVSIEPKSGSEASPSLRTWIQKLALHPQLRKGTNQVWIDYQAKQLTSPLSIPWSLIQALVDDPYLTAGEWQQLWLALSGESGGGLEKHWIPAVLHYLSPVHGPTPEPTSIPAFRRIGDTGSEAGSFGGGGLVRQLADLQNPAVGNESDLERFEAINRFVQSVTDNASAAIQIPSRQDMIIVEMDGKRLPLEWLGTGIHEVIILASAGTIYREQFVCIEEPEIHLHPILQRKLIRYLLDNTDNQYFIATHSAHLLDIRDATIFHVTLEDNQTRVRLAQSRPDKWAIAQALGYRASDILQANCVIWVEGPSDRIYLNHWIGAESPDFVEGIHYSIMFYGGRLLSHLSATDQEVEEFISLRSLNRHLAVVMDSDRESMHHRANQTKRRVKNEFDQAPGVAWVTQGREIENYVHPDILREAVETVYRRLASRMPMGQFDRRLVIPPRGKRKARQLDKIKVAREVASREVNLDVLDLKKQIRRLVEFIRQANA